MSEEPTALIIVDVQPTFTEGGALGVNGGNAVAERIADFVTDNADEYDFIVTTQDWHIDPGSHFSDHPDFVDSWPPHGVAGTEEAELHPAIASLPADAHVKKGEYQAAYSGFEAKDENGEGLEDLLRDHDIRNVDVVGIAESHCVKETALDAVRNGFVTRVFSDLTVPVDEAQGVEARKEMDEAGVEQLSSADAFGFYEEDEDAAGDEYDSAPGEDAVEGAPEEYDLWDSDDEDDFNDGAGSGLGAVEAAEDAVAAADAAADADATAERAAAAEVAAADLAAADALDDLDLGGLDDLPDEDEIDFSGELEEGDLDFSDIDFDPKDLGK